MICLITNSLAGDGVKDLITIIIPVYNVEKYIDATIKSVLVQTYISVKIWIMLMMLFFYRDFYHMVQR